MFANEKPNNHFQYGNSGQMVHQNSFVPQGDQQPLIRNQSYPYPAQPQNFNWSAYQQPNPYYPQQPSYQPYPQNYQSGYVPQNMPYPNQPNTQKDSQFLFQNPLQPKDEMFQNQSYTPMNGYPMMNPYPKQNNIPKQPSGMQSLMNSFKSQDGSVDFNKMVNTAGQMMSAVNQVSSLVKGFGGFFKA